MKNRRFIAGAVCPRCAVMDRIFIESESGINKRECLGCGYKEYMQSDGTTTEILTRVNKDEHGNIVDGFKTVAEYNSQKSSEKELQLLNTTTDLVKIISSDSDKKH